MLNKLLIILLIFCGTIINLSAQSITFGYKIEDKIYNKDAQVSQPVLVIMKAQFQPQMQNNNSSKAVKGQYVYQNLKAIAQETQVGIKSYFNNNNIKYRPYHLINALATQLDLVGIYALAQREDVKYIISNAAFTVDIPRPQAEGRDREAATEWGIKKIHADSVWAMGYTGQGVVIAGADTGYDWDHEALKTAYRGWDGTNFNHDYNWFDAIFDPLDGSENSCGFSLNEPCDDFGHGTHTMGTMVGQTEDNNIGVAPSARWIGARNMNGGVGTPERYIACFEYFLAPTDSDGQNADPLMAPDVINNSWGCPINEGCNLDNFNIMDGVINNLRAAGIVVVVSAGNSGGAGCGSVSAPASIYEGSFTIGATDTNDSLAGFSSRGPVFADGSNRLKPNVSAPGVAVYSSTPDDTYATYNGTSMAGPHVCGTVALMISANPALAGQVEVIETILETTAIPYFVNDTCGGYDGNVIPNPFFGYGRIDALAAVEAALIWQAVRVNNPPIYKIYSAPNPAKNYLNISLDNKAIGNLRIYNIQGQKVLEMDKISKPFVHLDIQNWQSGLYYGVIQNNLENNSFKFVKE